MVRTYFIIALLVGTAVAQCGPPNYTCSSTSASVVQTPVAPIISTAPTGTSCIGQCINSIGYDTSLNALGKDPILRASDGTVLDGHSPSSTCSGGDNDEAWSCTGRTDTSAACQNATLYLVSACFGGATFVEGIKFVNGAPTIVAPFPPHTSGTYHPTPASSATFSNQDPSVTFEEITVSVTSAPLINKVTYAWDGTVGHSPTFTVASFYDPTSACSVWPAGYKEGWSGPLSHDTADNVFAWPSSNVFSIAQGVDTLSVTNGQTAFTVNGPALPVDGSLIHAIVIIGGVANTYAIATLNGSGTAGTLDQNYAGTTNAAATFKVNGGQGSGIYIFAFQVSPAACAVYNTFTGVITAAGAWTGGSIDDGCNGMYLHDGFLFQDGIYYWASGARSGTNCGTGVHFWQTGTTHGVPATAQSDQSVDVCTGHQAMGWHNAICQNASIFYSNVAPTNANSGTPIATFGNITSCDSHQSKRGATTDNLPMISGTENNNFSTSGSVSTWANPYQNEIVALFLDGHKVRFGHNFILGPGNAHGCSYDNGSSNIGPFDAQFTAQYGIGAVSQDRRLWSWSSSMLGGLGLDAGVALRSDLFVMGLDAQVGSGPLPPVAPSSFTGKVTISGSVVIH